MRVCLGELAEILAFIWVNVTFKLELLWIPCVVCLQCISHLVLKYMLKVEVMDGLFLDSASLFH